MNTKSCWSIQRLSGQTKKQVAEGKIEAEVTYNQTIAEEKAKGEVITS